MTLHAADRALAVIEQIVERDTDPALVALTRARIGALLGVGPWPAEPTEPREQAAAAFVDQFVIDVAGLDDTVRGPVFEHLGADAAVGFAQAVYVIDLGIRRRIVLDKLGLDAPPTIGAAEVPADLDLWSALLDYLRTVAVMRDLDPATSELVRLRIAATHDCRICRSRISLKAIDALGSPEPLESIVNSRPVELAAPHAAAVAFVSAIITQPTEIDAAMVSTLRQHFSATQIFEMLHDTIRNSSNKFAVSIGGDAAVVEDGIEYYDLDADGEVVADVDPSVVRKLTLV
jgi:alkylhydroperoxidase family enzyme